MILIKTNAPYLIEATALHSIDFVQNNTNLCTFTNVLSAEYDLAFAYNAINSSPDPVDALRKYMQKIMLVGNQLDPQTLILQINNVLAYPSQMRDPLIREIDEAIAAAQKYRKPPDDTEFPSLLSRIINDCSSPCNYFSTLGDVLGLMGASTQMNTDNTNVAWDKDSTFMHAPLNVANTTFNKIANTTQLILAGAATAVKSIYSNGLEPLFNNTRRETEEELVTQGKSMSFVSHGSYLATDPFPYFQTQNNASNILARAKSSLRDCARLSEFKYRYNPADPEMNLSVVSPVTISVNTEGTTVQVDAFGKIILPDKKPNKMSIKEALDYKESNYEVDDEENWNTNPTTGMTEKEPSNPNAAQTAPAAAAQKEPRANVRGSRVTDYGQLTDPYLDANTAKGIGIAGIGEGNGPASLQGGNYLLKDYSMAVSPDVEAQMRSTGIKPGDWVSVSTSSGQTLTKRWDDVTSSSLAGRVDFYNPVGKSPQLDANVVTIVKASGPPLGYVQPPRYVYGKPAGFK